MIIKNVNRSKLNRNEYSIKMHVFLWKSRTVRVDAEGLDGSEDTQIVTALRPRLQNACKSM